MHPKPLSEVESRYSQMENEALKLVWASEQFNLCVFGWRFKVKTDHKQLKYILTKASKPLV